MRRTLTIRNLAEPVWQKLRMRAAVHGRSIEAEALEILKRGVEDPNDATTASLTPQKHMMLALDSLSGIWKGRGRTDEMMRELRGED